jgi:hypothetical protein
MFDREWIDLDAKGILGGDRRDRCATLEGSIGSNAIELLFKCS